MKANEIIDLCAVCIPSTLLTNRCWFELKILLEYAKTEETDVRFRCDRCIVGHVSFEKLAQKIRLIGRVHGEELGFICSILCS